MKAYGVWQMGFVDSSLCAWTGKQKMERCFRLESNGPSFRMGIREQEYETFPEQIPADVFRCLPLMFRLMESYRK